MISLLKIPEATKAVRGCWGATKPVHIAVAAAALALSAVFSYLRYFSAAGALLHAIFISASAWAFLSASFLPYAAEAEEKSMLPQVIFAAAGLYLVSLARVLSYQSSFHSRSFDSGIYLNTIWLMSQGYLNYTHVGYLGLAHDFGMHFEPFIFVLAGLYRLFTHPYFLFALQPLAVFGSMVPLYLLAEKLLKNKKYAFMAALAFGISPYLAMLPDWDFHPLAFYPFLIIMFFYFAESGNFVAASVFGLLAASIKEETLFYMSAASVFFFLRNGQLAAHGVIKRR